MVEGRRGTASVMFTDLVGSTALRSGLGEAAADQLRRRHDSALNEVVARHGGTVVKSTGDGIMATFASAGDAVEAGVASQQAISGLATELGVSLEIRVGISAGDVSWEDGDCFGLPVVEAARLEAAAEPGQILCAAIVQALAGSRMNAELEPVGELTLKGLDAPVSAFSVAWSRPEPTVVVLEPFAGRVEPLRRLAELFEELANSSGATVLVGGEPGAGKSRLLTEALRTDSRVDVVWGHSYGGEVIPLGPVIEIFDALASSDPARLRRCAAHHDRVVAEISPNASAAWGDLVQPDPIDLVHARQRLHSAIAETLAAWGRERPLAVVFDDLHWADELSVSVFRALGRRAATAPILLAGTYRPTDLDRGVPWADAMPQMVREVSPTQIDLDGLTVDEMSDLVGELTGQDLDSDLVAGLATATGGNPLFVLEISRQLAESGAFEQHSSQELRSVPLDLPRGLRQVIAARVDRLGDRTERFLGVASLFDAPFELNLVAELAEVSEEEALTCVETAQRARLVEPTAQFDVYAFSHDMVRQTLYEDASQSRMVRLHRRIAETTAARVADRPTGAQAAAIAHHYACSAAMAGADAGAPWASLAALAARDDGAFADAVRFSDIAEQLSQDPSAMTPELLIARAQSYAAMADIDSTRTACRRAASVLGEPSVAELYATCARTLDAAGANVAGVWDFATEALPWCGSRRDESWLTLRNYQLFGIEMRDPAYTGAPMDSNDKQELREVAVRLGSRQFLRLIHRDRTQILSHPDPSGFDLSLAGDHRRAAEVHREQIAHARRNGLGGEELISRGSLMRILHSLGEIDQQQQVLAEGLELYERTPWANATAQFRAGIDITLTIFNPPAADEPMVLPHPELRPRTNEQSVQLVYKALANSVDPSALPVKAPALAVNAMRAAIHGDRELTLACLEAAVGALIHGPAGSLNGPAMPSWFIESLIPIGETRWIHELRTAAHRVIAADFYYADFDPRHALGRIEGSIGNRDEAIRWFAEARRVRAEQGAAPHVALVDLHEAETELRLGGSDKRVLELLETARPEFERIHATARLEDCDRIQAAL